MIFLNFYFFIFLVFSLRFFNFYLISAYQYIHNINFHNSLNFSYAAIESSKSNSTFNYNINKYLNLPIKIHSEENTQIEETDHYGLTLAVNTDDNLLRLELPISDQRLYRHLILPNKMEILLISDDKCDRAACALSIGVGSLLDPPEIQGLAHFLEHMVKIIVKIEINNYYKFYIIF